MNKYIQELEELLTFFEGAKLPEVPFKLNNYITVVGIEKFVEGEARMIRDYKGSDHVHDSLLKHLREFKEIVLKQ
jgi:hypothetical protein